MYSLVYILIKPTLTFWAMMICDVVKLFSYLPSLKCRVHVLVWTLHEIRGVLVMKLLCACVCAYICISKLSLLLYIHTGEYEMILYIDNVEAQ